MLATLGGLLALVLGLAILLLPLLAPELSRPRDAVWGALVLLLGLDLVTTAERLSGAPMLGVLSGGLLIGRLGSEVAQARWRQLSEEERQQLGSSGRWRRSLDQLLATLVGLIGLAGERFTALQGALAGARRPRSGGKRWVRPEQADETQSVQEVSDFVQIETLLIEAGALDTAEPEGGAAAAPAPADTIGEPLQDAVEPEATAPADGGAG